ncbi:MAG: type II toxin-antitoxin system VapC family toxin [Xanthomonadales bacterium]|nr:type II toxin-antitoxin system VapC family toxin [Xanthomonadales bacterium]
MKLAVDTNVLVRSVVRDDVRQARAADKALTEATLIAVSLPCLCELVWVLRKVYRFDVADIAAAIRALAATEKVAMNRSAVDAGLALLEAGGDFADAILAHESQWLGAEVFVSFDRQAVSLLNRAGLPSRLL